MDVEGSRGRSQLVASIMDIVTSSFDPESDAQLRHKLPGSVDLDDIAEALEVLKEGGLHLKNDTGDGVSSSTGPKDRASGAGSGLKVLGGTAVLGLQRNEEEAFYEIFLDLRRKLLHNVKMCFGWTYLSSSLKGSVDGFTSLLHSNKSKLDQSYSAYGLWDDLQSRDVAVPLAAWAVATWADSSTANRAKIVELDKDGQALLSAMLAPERTVKWHGATAIHLLLENKKQPLSDVTAQWSTALLDMAAESCRHQDSLLAETALSALTSCVKECEAAKSMVLDQGLSIMRGLAKQTEADTIVQRALAEALFVATESGNRMPLEESKKWSGILLRWVCSRTSEKKTRSFGSSVLNRIIENLGRSGIPIFQAWLAMLLIDLVKASQEEAVRQKFVLLSKEAKARGSLQTEVTHSATHAAAQLAKVVSDEAAAAEASNGVGVIAESAAELPMADLLGLDTLHSAPNAGSKEQVHRVSVADAASAVLKAIKALTELSAEDDAHQKRIIEAGGLCLLKRFLLEDDYDQWASAEAEEVSRTVGANGGKGKHKKHNAKDGAHGDIPTSHLRKHAARLLMILSSQPGAVKVILGDQTWCEWLQKCAYGKIPGCRDPKVRSYAHMTLSNLYRTATENHQVKNGLSHDMQPRYTDMIYILNLDTRTWKYQPLLNLQNATETSKETEEDSADGVMLLKSDKDVKSDDLSISDLTGVEVASQNTVAATSQLEKDFEPVMDVVFVHGLCGGPFKTWRVNEEKPPSTISSRVVHYIDKEESGIEGSCWPSEWLPNDISQSRILTVKYKTNLSQWSGATLPLEEVSSILLEKLLAAGVGERPVAFVTHSMGGLVVKQMLFKAAQDESRSHLPKRTSGIIFYSCPHFGSKLADMPWRMGLLLRPAPSIGELRSGSPRLEELNHFIRQLHHKGDLQVLSFCETKVTPVVEGYGGWALRMEVVPIESAYPGYGDLVVLDGIDHVSSCKPVNHTDPAYLKAVEFLQKLKSCTSKTL
ncbi:hypothetical protein O6H91_04G032200 [Diphasiastrum complanatum]|nr:hypothetical protein O6H91_04G032200 [Diphasiastrum complanatum]